MIFSLSILPLSLEQGVLSMKQVYSHEGSSGMNKFLFDVYEQDHGGYLVEIKRISRKKDPAGNVKEFLNQKTVLSSDTKDGLKTLDYPKLRSVKIFLNSDFFEDKKID